jgi:Zn-finger nucleic acid-binding protein
MDEMTCPQCEGTMRAHRLIDAEVARCTSCHGIFLARADLGALSEAETEWHRGTGPHTEPLPRITADMAPPPPAQRPRASSFIETLFDG